jgi:PadR family transcriptional regulator PadR
VVKRRRQAQASLKGHVDLLVLAVLESGPSHGYAVIEEIKSRSADDFDLPEGTVYPVLHALEADGLVSSGWSTVSGRRRRTYSLTPAGRQELQRQRREWGRFRAAVDTVVGDPSWGGRPSPARG